MYYAEIKEYDIANGPGVRLSFFVSGCTHHCRGCFNEMTWDFHYGTPYTKETEDHLLELLEESAYMGMTLQNQKALLPLIKRFKKKYPEKTLWIFTGYQYDRDLIGRMWDRVPETKEILERTDVLVDGEYVEEKKDITLLYKGSSNQRTIDVQKSLLSGNVVLWDPGEVSVSQSSHL